MSCSQTSRATSCATPRLFNFIDFAAVRCASCCRYRIALRRKLLAFCDGCHSLFLASSPTGCARKRPQLRYIPILNRFCLSNHSRRIVPCIANNLLTTLFALALPLQKTILNRFLFADPTKHQILYQINDALSRLFKSNSSYSSYLFVCGGGEAVFIC